MTLQPIPDLSLELEKRIRLIRQDMNDLLFRFIRGKEPIWHESQGHRFNSADTAKRAFTQAVRIGKGRVVIILLLIPHLLQVALCGCDPSRR